MAGRRLGELVVAEVDEEEIQEENELNEDNEEEENEEGDDGERDREIRLNANGVGADDAPPREPIVIELGTPIYPIQVGDLPIHGSEYREILRTCPPLQED